ncbi:MAG: SDR family oxidoreductase [Stagnimonas sp.]|nr:SDR family oxidoreductase [Stagnimonas sp.]
MSTPKIALVTGANKGLGFETARQLGKQGIHVIIAARDPANAAAATLALQSDGIAAEALTLDVTSASSIAAGVKSVTDKHGHLDILINNAGVMHDAEGKKPSEQTLDAWRKTFDTNVFGLVAVTNAFLPLIKKSSAGRIVNLSSILGSNTLHQQKDSGIYDYKIPAYNVSKSAVNAWTVHLAHELKDTAIKVNAAHPGHVQTDMGGASAPMAIPDGAKTSVALATLAADGPTGGYFHLDQALPW